MRALLIGAGAVGTVVHRALEEQKGNEITFLLRPDAVKPLRTKIVDLRTNQVRVRERPTSLQADKSRPVIDAVLLCVRADQLEAALDMLGPVPPTVRFMVVTPGDPSVVRARYSGNVVVRLSPMFFAYVDEEAVHLWQVPLVKSLVQHDDDAGVAFAEELAAALEAGGVPARAKKAAATDPLGDALQVVLAGYALAQYDADALAADRSTLTLVGNAIGEVLSLDGVGFTSALLRGAAAPVLRAVLTSSSMSPNLSKMWRLHGPKADGQTRSAVEGLLERAKMLNRDTPALAEVNERLKKTPGPVTLRKEATP